MKDSKEHKNYISNQEFISEFAKRTQMSNQKAYHIVTAMLEILEKSRRNNEPIYFDTFYIQFTRDSSDKYSTQ